MRKCPNCGSINTDDKQTCGVCGNSLSGTVALSLEQVEHIRSPEFHIDSHFSMTAIATLIVGVVLLGAGGFVLYLVGPFNPFGFIPLMIGLFTLVVGVNSLGTKRTRPWRGSQRSKAFNWTRERIEADKKEKKEGV